MFKQKEGGLKKMYKCKYCKRAISNEINLRSHLQEFCNSDPNRFEMMPQMKIERFEGQEVAEIKTNVYKCQYCHITFSSRSGIRQHLNSSCTSDPKRQGSLNSI